VDASTIDAASINASVSPVTQLYAGVFDLFEPVTVFKVDLKQQVYLSKEKNLAFAVMTGYSYPKELNIIWLRNYDDVFTHRKFETTLFAADLKLLCSYKLSDKLEMDAGFMYTFLKGYWTYIDFIDGVRYFHFEKLYRHAPGASLAVKWQPLSRIKLIMEINNDYGVHRAHGECATYLAFGPRFIFKRLVLDLASLWMYPPEAYPGIPFQFYPFLRANLLLGKYRTALY